MTNPLLTSLEEDFKKVGLIHSPTAPAVAPAIENPTPPLAIEESREPTVDGPFTENDEVADVIDLDVARVLSQIESIMRRADLSDDQMEELAEGAAKVVRMDLGAASRRRRKKARIMYRRTKAVSKRASRRFRRSAAGKRFGRLYKRAKGRLGHLLKSGKKRLHIEQQEAEATLGSEVASLLGELNAVLSENGQTEVEVTTTPEVKGFANLALSADLLSRAFAPFKEAVEELETEGVWEEEDAEDRESLADMFKAIDALGEMCADFADQLRDAPLSEDDAPEVEAIFKECFAFFFEMLDLYDTVVEDVELLAMEDEDAVGEAGSYGNSDDDDDDDDDDKKGMKAKEKKEGNG